MRYLSSVYDPPRKNLGLDFYPQNPYGFTPGLLTTDGAPIYHGIDDPVYLEKLQNNTEYTKEDFRNAVRNARDNFDKQTNIVYNFHNNPNGIMNPFWEAQRIYNQIKDFERYDESEYQILRNQIKTGELSPEDASSLKRYQGYKEHILSDFGVKTLQELKDKRDEILKSTKSPIMALDNYHTNQSRMIDGKRYLSPPLALELAYRKSGKKDQAQAGAYYLERDIKLPNKKPEKFSPERFYSDPQYRIEVTKEYRKLPGVSESLDAYRNEPIEYTPSASFYGHFNTGKDYKGSHYSGNAIHLDYGQLRDSQIHAELGFDPGGNLDSIPSTLDHELSHRENNYLRPIVQKLIDEYIAESIKLGSTAEPMRSANAKKVEDNFYDALNRIYPQQRVIEGLSDNSPFVTTPFSQSPRLKPDDSQDFIYNSREYPSRLLGHVVDKKVKGPFARNHEEATEETLADIKAIQKILHDNKEYGYDYADPNSFVTQEMLEKLIKNVGGKNLLYTDRVFGRYKNEDGTYNLDKILKVLNLTSNEPSTPSYMPNRRFFPSAGEYSYS